MPIIRVLELAEQTTVIDTKNPDDILLHVRCQTTCYTPSTVSFQDLVKDMRSDEHGFWYIEGLPARFDQKIRPDLQTFPPGLPANIHQPGMEMEEAWAMHVAWITAKYMKMLGFKITGLPSE